MLKFKSFLNNIKGKESLEKYPVLHNFLHHLSSPTVHDHSDELSEAHPVAHIKDAGITNAPQGNLFHHLRNGFHAAIPEDEHPTVTKQKAKESRNHFRQFMHERGGLASNNTASLTGDNGKTRLSSGEGFQTIGLQLAPHGSAGYKHNLCPKASSECRKNCLGFTAGGNKQYPEASFRAKLLRTQYLAEHPEHAGRLISHELGENEKWSDEHQSVHDKNGDVVGYLHTKSGKVKSENPKEMPHDHVKEKLESGEFSARNIKSGFRGNMTSDLPYEHLMPKKFFERHHKTQFYDYTKIASRLKNKDLPSNYSLALSHTGTGHDESNDKDAIDALERGDVVAMVHQKQKKGTPPPTHVEDVQTGKRYPIENGDDDDNVFDRHRTANLQKGHPGHGVVSGLKLKGVKNEAAGHFANPIDPDGIIRINHPKK